jgi:hypothetical protein
MANARAPHLRVSTNHDEILRIVKKMQNNGFKITLWQNIEGKRKVMQAIIQQINLKEKTFSLRPFGPKEFSFKKNFSIYLHGNEQSLLFKANTDFNSSKLIVVHIPKEVRVLEKRLGPRFILAKKPNHEVKIKKIHGFKEETKEFNLMGFDLSMKGLSFRLFAHDLTQFAVGNHLFICAVSGFIFQQPVEGQIMYIKAVKISEQTMGTDKVFRVGVKFVNEISRELLNSILR